MWTTRLFFWLFLVRVLCRSTQTWNIADLRHDLAGYAGRGSRNGKRKMIDDDGLLGIDVDSHGVGNLYVLCRLDGHQGVRFGYDQCNVECLCIALVDLGSDLQCFLGDHIRLLIGCLRDAAKHPASPFASPEGDGLSDREGDCLDLDRGNILGSQDDARFHFVPWCVAGLLAVYASINFIGCLLVIIGNMVYGPIRMEFMLFKYKWVCGLYHRGCSVLSNETSSGMAKVHVIRGQYGCELFSDGKCSREVCRLTSWS
jgi:hypothetical protein